MVQTTSLMAVRCLQSDHIYCDRRTSTALRRRGRLYANGVSEQIARTITVPPESGERARWKWLLPRLRRPRVSRCSSEHRPDGAGLPSARQATCPLSSEALSTLATGGSLTTLLLRRPQDNQRRHGSNLDACEYEELPPVRTACRSMGHRMGRHFFTTSLRGGQAHRGKDFPTR